MDSYGVQAICTDGVADDGMLQREIVIPSGPNQGTYTQFILTDTGVSGNAAADPFTAARGSMNFVNEDFIKQNHRAAGLANKLTIIDSDFIDPDTEERFVNSVVYKYGWALDSSNPWITAYQLISTLDYSGDPLNPVETFNDTADIVIDSGTFDNYGDVVFSQALDLTDRGITGLQKFVYDKKAGFGNVTNRTAGLGGDILPTGDLTWNQYDTLAAIWVGQVLNTSNPTMIGYTKYKNLSTGQRVSYTDLADPEANNWPPPALVLGFNVNGPFDPIPAAKTIASGMEVDSPTATVAPPTPLAPTITAGTGSSDTTVVSVPIPYDGWTVTNGVFTMNVPCPGGAVCQTPLVNEGGLYQRIVTVSGVDYVQTIVTEENATGDPTVADFAVGSLAFKNESFVRYNSLVKGIATQLHLAEQDLAYQTTPLINPPDPDNYLPEEAGQFIYNTIIKTGWAHGGPLDPRLEVEQTAQVGDTNYLETSSAYDYFHLKRGETQSDTALDMLAVEGTSLGDDGYADPIMYATSIRSGAFNNTAHDSVLDPFLLPSISGNIDWNPGDAVQVTWVGADYPTSAPDGRSKVSSTAYTNLSTGERIESSLTDGNIEKGGAMLTVTGPETWDALFGTAPIYSDPFVSPLPIN